MALADLLRDHVGEELLNYSIDGNPLVDYLEAIVVFLAALLVLRLFKFVIIRKLKSFAAKTRNRYDDLLIKIIDKVGWLFYIFLAIYLAFQFVAFPEVVESAVNGIVLILVGYHLIRSAGYIIDFAASELIESRKDKGEKVDRGVVNLLALISKTVLWSVVVLLVLSNLGYDISALLTGLGIGGIALALALQTILSDVFAYFSIHIDKPFRLGDFIVVGSDMGTVERIGIKTTRVRTLQGQELVISNKELTESRINNFKRMTNRRITFSFGIGYDTPAKKIKSVPAMVEKIISGMEFAKFDRAHFNRFSPSTLDFEVVYYMTTPDYNKYMDTQQSINVELKEALEREKISMPYPTQTVLVKRS